ncbi:5985_t:CDS:1, partial [Racocetra fulgida]
LQDSLSDNENDNIESQASLPVYGNTNINIFSKTCDNNNIDSQASPLHRSTNINASFSQICDNDDIESQAYS